MKKQIFIISVMILFVSVGLAYAQSSTNYQIKVDVISGGGGVSSSPSYVLSSIIGQPSVIGFQSSTSYADEAGYIYSWLESKPTFNPMGWTTPPYQTGTTSISMVATTATDLTTPINYYFDFVDSPTGGTGGLDSGWQSSTFYTNNGLQANHQYGYQVKARDGANNETGYSTPTRYVYTAIETPGGITFGTVTSTSIQVQSTNTPSGLSRGSSGLLIENTTNTTNPGWKQDNSFWASNPLTPNTSYSFRAKARNGDAVETGYTSTVSKYTLANVPGVAWFSNITQTCIRANWTANENPAGTQYYCENVTAGTNSGWVTSTSWDSCSLTCGTSYTFQVKARNGDGIDTGWTSLGSQSTQVCPNTIPPAAPAGLRIISSSSSQIDLAWNPNAEPDLGGYRVYYGTASGVYTSSINVGNVTTYSLTGLPSGQTYYIALRALDMLNNESEYSLEVHRGLISENPLNDTTEFVKQQYRDFLNREAETAGLQHWVNIIDSGAMTRAQVIESFFWSEEFGARIAPIVRLYFAYFLRIPDYGGLMYWINVYKSGWSLGAISDSFAGSEEFQQTYGALSNESFVNLVYQNILGRAPDSSGYAFWVGELNSGRRTRGQVMIGFSESAEYKGLTSHEVYVTMMYMGMLRRAPEEEGFNFWVDYLDSGNSGLALIDGFLYSQEYADRF